METTVLPMSPWIAVPLMAAAAGGAHWALRRTGRRLPLLLSRSIGRVGSGGQPPFRRTLALVLLPIKIAVWVATALFITERIAFLHSARNALIGALDMSVRAPLVTLGEMPYSTLDVLALPAALVALWLAATVLTHVFKTQVLATAGVARGAQETVGSLARTVLVVIGSIVILQAWGINVSSLTMVASVLGVGIGFGLQNIANNFVSGLLINLEQPVKPGDFLNVAGFQGTVERVGSRSTVIRTLDHLTILVPNSRLLESEVVNWSHGNPVSRLHLPVGVAYGSSVARVREALLAAARSHPEVLADPRPHVEFHAFGPSALEFELLVWTADPRTQHILKSDLNYRVEASLRRHGIKIPFMQHDVHMHSPQLDRLVGAWGRRHFTEDELRDGGPADAPAAQGGREDDGYDGDLGPRHWTDVELEALVARMRSADGVDIRDRRHLLALYPRCFVGAAAVTWMTRQEGLTREEAVALGQLLVDRGIVHHVLDEHGFKDGNFFYRFYADEQREVGAGIQVA